ncbi:putative retroelement pol polyprotein [Cucumis melo var. makuwa]|uniref:Retroelement pol polyprotein n=1 Tax=Cucumis melo var. makuwa TaxID=1194695 RepID=A0A5A7TH57_CUCMM|nr:putative retroelement pol polyprotein [Cucumis melo var. makuwa]
MITARGMKESLSKGIEGGEVSMNEGQIATFMNGLSLWIKVEVECLEAYWACANDEAGPTSGESGDYAEGSKLQQDLRRNDETEGKKPRTSTKKEHREHHIRLKKGTDPNVWSYRSYQYKEEMEKLVDEMLVSGVIRPSASPYSSLVLLVKKKDGNCSFARARVGYFGHVIPGRGVEVDPEKIIAAKEMASANECMRNAGILGLNWILSKICSELW